PERRYNPSSAEHPSGLHYEHVCPWHVTSNSHELHHEWAAGSHASRVATYHDWNRGEGRAPKFILKCLGVEQKFDVVCIRSCDAIELSDRPVDLRHGTVLFPKPIRHSLGCAQHSGAQPILGLRLNDDVMGILQHRLKQADRIL